jgi:hypothetical protein
MAGVIAADISNFSGDFSIADWNEAFSIASPNRYSITRADSDVSLVGVIEWAKLKSAVQYLLGFSYVDTRTKKLTRVLPNFHPYFPWLYCSSISDIEPKGMGDGRTDPDFAEQFTYGAYDKVYITANYTTPKYDILPDSSPDLDETLDDCGEYRRYTEWTSEPYSELLTMEGGQLLYNAPGYAIDGKPVIGSAPRVKLKKVKLKCIWREVPCDFVCNSLGIPTKLLDVQKCVNKYDFMGFSAGTLLCESVELDKYAMPVATDTLDRQIFYYDVTFDFIYFNPEIDPAAAFTERGWNLMPAQNGYFFPVRYPLIFGAAIRANVYTPYDFSACFQYVDVAPA